VAACSYEARKFGIHSAMPMKTAMKLCPHAIVLGGDRGGYSKYSRMVTEIIASKVPLFEKASIDEFYVDLTGMDKFFGVSKYVSELKQTIVAETGLPISYGLSTNKLVSKVATNEAKPNGQLEVPPGKERDFLAPLAIDKIPMIGDTMSATLKQMGIHIVRDLAAVPLEELEARFGKTGLSLWRRANGISDSPVEPYHEQKSISAENTFYEDTIDTNFLQAELVRLTERVGYELREEKKMAGCVAIKVRHSNFDTFTRQVTIPYTAADHIIIEKVKELFRQFYDGHSKIRLIGVKLSQLIPGNFQMSLFDNIEQTTRLYEAIDEVKNRFGKKIIRRAGGLGGK
jgi:DNA polymerase IV